MNQDELKRTSDDLHLNERLWQAWRLKNRKLDRAASVKGWKILKVAAVIVVVATIIQSLSG